MIKPEEINIYRPYLALVNEALDDLGDSPVLLDGGCGHSPILKQEYKRCSKVIGVDLDREGLERNQWVDEKHFVSLVDIPIQEDSVDLLVSSWVLEHIEDPQSVIREAKRVLKPGGYFIFIAPNKWSVYSLVTRLVPNKLHAPIVKFFYKRSSEDTFPTFFRMNTEKELDRLMGEVGFEKVAFLYNDDEKYIGFWRVTRPLAKLWQKVLSIKALRKIRAHIIGSYQLKKV